MSLDPLAAQGFTSALAYECGRPGYAQEAVRRLSCELGLNRSSTVLDLAAGTGQLSRVFASLVGAIVAVEPSEPMRRVLTERVPGAEVLAGTAEALPLPDGSVDAIVVGEAFHWFDGQLALGEMARVLRARGAVALLWNVPVSTDPPWPAELKQLIEHHRAIAVSDERRYSSGIWRRAFERSDHFEALSDACATHEQRLGRDAFVAQIASWSYIASLPGTAREAVLARVRQLAPDASTTVFRTDLHWTRRRR